LGGAPSPEVPVRPKIGDSRPAPVARVTPPVTSAPDGRAPRTRSGAPGDDAAAVPDETANGAGAGAGAASRRRRRGGRGRRRGGGRPGGIDGQVSTEATDAAPVAAGGGPDSTGAGGRRRDGTPTAARDTSGAGRSPQRGQANRPGASAAAAQADRSLTAPLPAAQSAIDDDDDGADDGAAATGGRRRRGRERKGRPVGRYTMCVHVESGATQIAVLEGRSLVELVVARPQDEVNQIDGNIYRGRVKNVLPGMEAAFVDIGTPKNAVLYWGDVQWDRDDLDREPGATRIEHLLRPGQTILCQVVKNPIGLKGARLTQEVSLPGRFVVLVPNSTAYGISKRLDDNERKRLRRILDDVRPEGHGLIVRTAAEGASADDLRRDLDQLLARWREIDERTKRLPAPALLYAEPHMAVRVIREELNEHYRGVVIDDPVLYEVVRSYVAQIDPALAERVELFDPAVEPLPLFERNHIHEQLHKALDRKVWLASGGSLIIERTEALTVIDVNTGKNVGSSSLEETVFMNNLEAADEIARQLRLRDIGGIIVIDFIDMEIKVNRQSVMAAFRAALARDKTPTQVFDISDLGLVEMTRKRVGEGLVETLSHTCPMCNGRGIVFEEDID
jgi:ribonuclease E